MLRILMLKGLPASGKSTFAKELVDREPGKWKRVNKDDLRAMLDNGRWSKQNERFVLMLRNFIVQNSINLGFSVIVDDTNLSFKHEGDLRKLAMQLKVFFEIKDFTDVPIEDCIQRDLKRPNSVGEQVIRKMYNDFLRPPVVPQVIDKNLPTACISDLDGTLALFGNANPYDRDFLQDKVNKPIKNILENYMGEDQLIFVSGRDSKYRDITIKWLEKSLNMITSQIESHLFMRPEGDKRKDAIVKKELYDANIKGKYNILFVLDDRNQMVEMWRGLGLTCLQVAEGNF